MLSSGATMGARSEDVSHRAQGRRAAYRYVLGSTLKCFGVGKGRSRSGLGLLVFILGRPHLEVALLVKHRVVSRAFGQHDARVCVLVIQLDESGVAVIAVRDPELYSLPVR